MQNIFRLSLRPAALTIRLGLGFVNPQAIAITTLIKNCNFVNSFLHGVSYMLHNVPQAKSRIYIYLRHISIYFSYAIFANSVNGVHLICG